MSASAWIVYSTTIALLLAGAAASLQGALSRLGLPTRWSWLASLWVAVALSLAPLFPAGGIFRGGAMVGEAGPVQAASSDVAPYAPGSPERGGSITLRRGIDFLFSSPYQLVLAGSAGTARVAQLTAALLPAGPTATRWIAGASITGTGILLALLLISMARLRSSSRFWPAARILGREVRIASQLGPAVVGIARPTIVLPQWALALPADELELVLRHEEEHLRARDTLLLTLGLVPLLLLPWNPAVWWQLSRLRSSVEVDCDRRVLRRGSPAHRYAALLVRLGSGVRPGFVPIPALAGSPSLLRRRLLAMKRHTDGMRRAPALLGGAATLALLLIACGTDAPVDPVLSDAGPATAATIGVAPEASIGTGTDEVASAGGTTSPDTITVAVQEDRAAVIVASGNGSPASILTGDSITVVVRSNAEMIRVAPDRPLVIVDGVIVANPNDSWIESLDIESIEVIRGAAAAELYGSRAQRGVISIRTKTAPTPN